MGAFVLAYHGKCFLGDGAHFPDVALVLHVEHRANVQAADGGMRVERASGVVLAEDVGQPVGVFRQILERNAGMACARSSMVRSSSSTADGPSSTMWRVISMES